MLHQVSPAIRHRVTSRVLIPRHLTPIRPQAWLLVPLALFPVRDLASRDRSVPTSVCSSPLTLLTQAPPPTPLPSGPARTFCV